MPSQIKYQSISVIVDIDIPALSNLTYTIKVTRFTPKKLFPVKWNNYIQLPNERTWRTQETKIEDGLW